MTIKIFDLPWHIKSIDEVELELASSRIHGLTAAEARARLDKFGPNKLIEEKPISPLRILLAQFNDLMIWVLLAALFVSGALLKEISDAVAIGAILILNALLGFRQEIERD